MTNKWYSFFKQILLKNEEKTDWTRFLLTHGERIASQIQNWMTIAAVAAAAEEGKNTEREEMSKRASMRANDHGSRVLGRSINEWICTRVPCNFYASVCLTLFVRVSVFFFIRLLFSAHSFLLWFPILHHHRERERDGRKRWVHLIRCANEMSSREKKTNLVDQKDWRWWLAMNSNFGWLHHMCVSADVCKIFFAPSLVCYRFFCW